MNLFKTHVYLYHLGVSSSEFGAELYHHMSQAEPKRLRLSFVHGVDWRTGVDVQHAGSFTHRTKDKYTTGPRFCRSHGDVTHGGPGISVL